MNLDDLGCLFRPLTPQQNDLQREMVGSISLYAHRKCRRRVASLWYLNILKQKCKNVKKKKTGVILYVPPIHSIAETSQVITPTLLPHSHLRPVQTWLVGEVFGLKGQRFGLFPTTWTPVAGSGRLNEDPPGSPARNMLPLQTGWIEWNMNGT